MFYNDQPRLNKFSEFSKKFSKIIETDYYVIHYKTKFLSKLNEDTIAKKVQMIKNLRHYKTRPLRAW